MGKKSNVHETHSSTKINGHTGKSQLRKRKSLKICHVNARSLLTSGRLLDLEILCSTNDIDVLCVTETWLNPDRVKEGASLIHIPGYSPPFRCDRIGRRGGGVAIFVRHGVNASTIQLPPQLEAVGVQLQLQKKKMLNIVSVYRPPDGKRHQLEQFIYDLDSILKDFLSTSNVTCLVGDFNAKSTQWWKHQKSNDAGNELSKLSIDHGLSQLVEGPTRIPQHSDASQLDLMFTNDTSNVVGCDILPPLSDHCPTVLHFNFTLRHLESSHFSGRIDYHGLRTHLSEADWSSVTSTTDIHLAVTAWETIVSSALETFSLPTRVLRENHKPWYTSDLSRLRRQRDRLFHKSKSLDKEHKLSIAYRKVRNLYVAELRFAERRFFARQCSKLSSKDAVRDTHRWWKTAKSVCGIKAFRSIPTLVENGTPTSSPLEKSELLNAFFAEQCTTLLASPSRSSPPIIAPAVDRTFSFRLLNDEDVLKKLMSLNVWKSAGLDRISNRVLKECAEIFTSPLTQIFNLSLKSGTFPSQWKKGLVCPVYKNKGSRSDVKCYRPITLLPCTSKVFEASSEISCNCTASKTLPYRTINMVFYLKGLLSGNSCQLLRIGKRPWITVTGYTPASLIWLKHSTRWTMICFFISYVVLVSTHWS